MAKRIISMLLCLVMLSFALVACKKGGDNGAETSAAPQEEISTGGGNAPAGEGAETTWETDENGDMTPKEGWCKVVKVINDYQVTRDLPAWLSGLQIEIKPNEVAAERTAYVTASSFTKSVVITINQTAKME